MRPIIEFLLIIFVRFILSLRYRLVIRGLKELKDQKGALFLPNHPAEIDPVMMASILYGRFKVRPVVLETMFTLPVLHSIMKYIHCIPIPNMDEGVSSYKLRRTEKILEELSGKLDSGENVLLYPAGGLQRSGLEKLKGASAVHSLVQEVKDPKIIMVRTRGLWGSSFSVAQSEGVTPDVGATLFKNIKRLFASLIFFLPRRTVEIEFKKAPEDFPFQGDRSEVNRALEAFYNEKGEEPPSLVSYSCWSMDIPEYKPTPEVKDIDLEHIPKETIRGVQEEFAKMVQKSPEDILPEHSLGEDLGLDSLDRSEILIWLDTRFGVSDVEIAELLTVGSVIQIANGRGGDMNIDHAKAPEAWVEINRDGVVAPKGKTLIEAFLHNADRMGKSVAVADEMGGVLSYKRLKLGALVLAQVISKMPGKYVGIMLPATGGVGVVAFGCMLAGKIPVMINWTLGPRNLDHVKKLTGIEAVITSKKFLDKLGMVELGPLEDIFVFVEDLREGEITTGMKLKGALLSMRSAEALLRKFNLRDLDENTPAVILFTSGSESVPKGVPLSHKNILTNIRDSIGVIPFEARDILYGFLPPFHSFGFTITTMLPLLSGLKVSYYPNPTESRRLARGIRMWGSTIVCGTPSFIKGIFQAGTREQISSVRFFVAGAEKVPDDLFEKVGSIGATMLEGYGITECAPVLSINYPERPRAGVGFPAPSCEILIVDPDSHEPVNKGDRGMILARGNNVFSGYLGENAPNPFTTVHDTQWYVTGDLGYLNEDGCLILSGRLKRFVKVGGEMISLPAMEEVLMQEFPPTGEEDGPELAIEAVEREGERPVLCLFSKMELELDEVNQALRKHGFSNVTRVNEVRQIDSIPLLGTGKTDYRSLKTILAESLGL